MFFFGKKCRKNNNVGDFLLKAIYRRKILVKNCQNVQKLHFFRKTTWFFWKKKPCFFSKSLNVAMIYWNASQNVMLLKNSQNVQSWVFWKKRWFLGKNIPRKSPNLANFFQKASRRRILLKNCQNVQMLQFFGKLDVFLDKKPWFFQSRLTWLCFTRMPLKG